MKKALRVIALVLAGLFMVYAILVTQPRKSNYSLDNPMRKQGELPLLIAHGGGNGEFPDNTLEAF